ncbi:nitroreductase family protein [Celerinatantimonas sp. YJH-8]|uniref:nitroreductase family protein n=1 Tax=Celerinatantimonas sp. YJH-8 TaxID=3228714 RepID=UPI0038BF35BC
MSIIPALQWRYALKHFSDKKVDDGMIEQLIDAARLSASAYGLQPFQVWVVEDESMRAKLSENAYGQTQLQECSQLLVFASETSVSDDTIDQYFQRYHQQTNTPVGSLNGYAAHIKTAMSLKSDVEKQAWADMQAYIALGSVMVEAAMLGIDACPMSGFDRAAFDRTLGLTEHNLSACAICAVGYRPEDVPQPIKVRKTRDEFSRAI